MSVKGRIRKSSPYDHHLCGDVRRGRLTSRYGSLQGDRQECLSYRRESIRFCSHGFTGLVDVQGRTVGEAHDEGVKLVSGDFNFRRPGVILGG